MTGNEIINMCDKIIKRQDLDKDLLLMFLNQQRKAIFRSTYLYKLDLWKKNYEPVNGVIDTPDLKQARYVEYCVDGRNEKLQRLNTFNEVLEIYTNVDIVGIPKHYVVLSETIKIIPAPTEGTINIYGEFYPADIKADNTEDTLTKELSDAIIYLGCAEYLDMLSEHDKAQFWRTKGETMVQVYLTEIKRQMTDNVDLLARDPFGNIGLVHGVEAEIGSVLTIDELTGGDI